MFYEDKPRHNSTKPQQKREKENDSIDFEVEEEEGDQMVNLGPNSEIENPYARQRSEDMNDIINEKEAK